MRLTLGTGEEDATIKEVNDNISVCRRKRTGMVLAFRQQAGTRGPEKPISVCRLNTRETSNHL